MKEARWVLYRKCNCQPDKSKSKVEAEKRIELVEEEVAAHRLENSRLSLSNQRLQEEVSEVLLDKSDKSTDEIDFSFR